MKLSILLAVVRGAAAAAGPAASLAPEHPAWGDTLAVYYDPAAADARFAAADEVVVVRYLYYGDTLRTSWAPMARRGGRFVHTLPVAPGLSHAAFSFVTRQAWDQGRRVATMVYRPDGVPARGAHQHHLAAMPPDSAEAFFARERQLYPDNYAVFRDRWAMARLRDGVDVEAMVTADLAWLADRAAAPPPGMRYAQVYGYMLLGREAAARRALAELAARHPTSPLTGAAFDDYRVLAFTGRVTGDGPEAVERLLRELLVEHPEIPYARAQVRRIAADEALPLAAVEAICAPWMAEVPDHPGPYLSLAQAYRARGVQPARAGQLMERAAGLLLEGKLHYYEDLSGKATAALLPAVYQDAAELALEQADYGRALAMIEAAQAVQTKTMPGLYLTEGAIWAALHDDARAEAAYLAAWRRGAAAAAPKLRAYYEARHGGTAGFDAYLDARRRAPEPVERRPAPDFTATTLGGETVTRDALRGKVAVLNFWFTSCAPCLAEMPGLNELVRAFDGEEVVFIAFALDAEAELRSFLQAHPFDYRIVPSAYEVVRRFEVSAYPTHVILDRNGDVAAFMTGGSEDRHEDLRPVIERELAGTAE